MEEIHFCGVAVVHRDMLKKTGTSCLIWPTSPEKLILGLEIIKTQMNVNGLIMNCRQAPPSS